MAGDELDEELRPRGRVELPGVVGYRRRADAVPEPRPAERLVGEHADLPLLRQRQNRLFDLARVDGVVDADEVERLFPHDVDDLLVLLIEGRRHADVLDPPLLLDLLQDGELCRHIPQVVDLDEIDLRLLDARERLVDLLPGRPWIRRAATATTSRD